MVNTNNRDIKESVRIAIIFLLTGLSLGSGFVLCVLDFVPIGAITLRLFGSLAVGAAILFGITAAATLKSTALYHKLKERENKDVNPSSSHVKADHEPF